MLFNTPEFFAFLAIVFLLYYCPLFKQIQVYILILAGFSFMAFNGMYSFLFFVCSVICNTFFNLLLIYNKNQITRRNLLMLSVSVNVLVLFLIKYTSSMCSLMAGGSKIVEIILPVGISFYTFQAISMLVDTYKENTVINNITAENSVLYLAFFPNLVSGPLIRNETFEKQINPKQINDIQWGIVIKHLIVGYFLKVVIADNLQNQTIYVAYPYYLQYSPIQLIVMMFAYSGQIFADFAGYSLIAQGIALLFGYRLPENFTFPYISKSIGEFWHRWHRSLSEWLKTYVYIPLGGNRKGKIRTCINLFLVMLIGGFWHGSDWKYPIWGAIYGILLVIERIINIRKESIYKSINLLRTVVIFTVVSWLWLFFKLDSLGDVFAYTKAIFSRWDIWKSLNIDCCAISVLYCIPILIYHMIYLFYARLKECKFWDYLYYGLYAGMIMLIVLNRGTTNAFVYVQF